MKLVPVSCKHPLKNGRYTIARNGKITSLLKRFASTASEKEKTLKILSPQTKVDRTTLFDLDHYGLKLFFAFRFLLLRIQIRGILHDLKRL